MIKLWIITFWVLVLFDLSFGFLSPGLDFSQPQGLLMFSLLVAGVSGMFSLFFALWDQALTGLGRLLKRWGRLSWILPSALVFLSALFMVVAGENMFEKLSRYRQFVVKTSLGAPLWCFFLTLPYARMLRQRLGTAPVRRLTPVPWVVFSSAWVLLNLWLDIRWRPEYFFIHILFKWAILMHVAYAVEAVLKRVALRRLYAGFLLLSFLGVAAVAFAPDTSQFGKSALLRRTLFSSAAHRLLQRTLDFDGDGYSARLGGGDADDQNPLLHPDRPEIPGNGLDDNGVGGDEAGGPTELFGSAPFTTRIAPESERLNVIVITLCSFRYDHFSFNGYPKKSTPHLEAFYKEAVRFEKAYSSYPTTPHSVGGLLTGWYATRFIRTPEDERWSDFPTLADYLREAGYRTASIVPSGWFAPYQFWAQGFDVFDNTSASLEEHFSKKLVTADKVVDKAVAFLQTARSPFFLHLLLFDPHELYMSHPEWNFGGQGDRERYDQEIAFADRELGRLFEYLSAAGRWSDTAVMVVGDHGEEFFDHGGSHHGQTLYDESVHVVWMTRAPGLKPRSIRSEVSTINLTPTVLDWLGMRVTSRLDGESWKSEMTRGEPSAQRKPVYLVGHKRRGVLKDGYKLIYHIRDQYYELYDMRKDPKERINLFDKLPSVREPLLRELHEAMDRYDGGIGTV